MSSGKLYTYQDNFRAFKALIASEFSGKKVETDAGFSFGKSNKEAKFLEKFPLGKVPAFETKNNESIFESNAIAYYVADEKLRGDSELDKSLVIQWMSFADSELLPSACSWVFPILGITTPHKPSMEKAKEDLKVSMGALNNHLLNKTFLVGERISLADIVVACNLLQLYKNAFDPSYREPFTNVNRWFTTLVNQAQFKAVLGEVKLCDKVAVVESKSRPRHDSHKKDKPKKEEKAKPKPETKEVEDEADDGLSLEPKRPDPFGAFPKGKMDLDDFKRFYSNNEVADSVPYFWSKFDKDAYSIWHCEYKYTEDLTKVFMSCNLMSGMMQRLDKMRKNAFGSLILFGEDNNSTISGVWFWKGPELAFTLSPDWQVDYESYEWKKLDPDSPDTKKMVNEYFSWEGDFGGKKFNQAKIFK